MKRQKLIFFLVSTLIVILVYGCTKPNSSQGAPSFQPSPTIPAGKASPTATFTNVINNATPTLTLIPVSTPMPSLSAISTVIPALSEGAARVRLLDILANNGDCRLPCLWGIMPGKTTYQEAKEILVPLSSISDFTAFTSGVGNIVPFYTEGDLIIYVNVDFVTNDDIVNRVSFEGRALKEVKEDRGSNDVFNSMFFGKKFGFYMLPQILSEYGPPTSVMLLTLAEIPISNRGPGRFNILLLYPDQGILAHYTTEMHVVGNNVIGCPANAHIEMELFPSGNRDSFFESLAQTMWSEEYIKNNYKPLEKVTSMSIEEFYQTFRQPIDGCLETPANLWPAPER